MGYLFQATLQWNKRYTQMNDFLMCFLGVAPTKTGIGCLQN